MGFIDLHLHTNCSDGVYSPKELVAYMKELGFSTIAIADHDTVDGVEEAIVEGQRLGVEVIPAVEFSVSTGKYQDIHILGLFIDHKSDLLIDKLMEFRQVRVNRAIKMVERINQELRKQNLPIIDIKAAMENHKGIFGRPHIARVMMDNGIVSSINEAFEKYLMPFNIKKAYFDAAEAIKIIHHIGGVSILAHPQLYCSNKKDLVEMVSTFARINLQGIEILSPDMPEDLKSNIVKLAKKYDLVLSGGSDFHKKGEGREAGEIQVPPQFLEKLRQRRLQIQSVGK